MITKNKLGRFSKAFTLAEILLSLSIIGIVAAIALPSLLGNVSERAFDTQKKALYARFSQALPLLPSLNGYGVLEGTFSEGRQGEEGYVSQNIVEDTAAEIFIRDGLSKVMKVTNICAIPKGKSGSDAAKYLSDCGIPDKINSIRGNSINLSTITTLAGLNPLMTEVNVLDTVYTNLPPYIYQQLDTKAAAFETVNGESILVYYNPNCRPYLEEGQTTYYYAQEKVCANFIYDLNGKKGPNAYGKDIGFITAFYATSPSVVAPTAFPVDFDNSTFEDAQSNCETLGEDAKLPNIEEIGAIFVNSKLVDASNESRAIYWSSTRYGAKAWYQSFVVGRRRLDSTDNNVHHTVRCIKK